MPTTQFVAWAKRETACCCQPCVHGGGVGGGADTVCVSICWSNGERGRDWRAIVSMGRAEHSELSYLWAEMSCDVHDRFWELTKHAAVGWHTNSGERGHCRRLELVRRAAFDQHNHLGNPEQLRQPLLCTVSPFHHAVNEGEYQAAAHGDHHLLPARYRVLVCLLLRGVVRRRWLA